jgi:hypothetical protein
MKLDPFGATPVCPCRKSKKPTPRSVACPFSIEKDEVPGIPQAVTNALRAFARRIFALVVAPFEQEVVGSSTIIVPGVVTPQMTRWMSESS